MLEQTTAPPAYDPVATSENPDDNPPSYFNVMGQLKVARQQSNSPADLVIKTAAIVCGSCNMSSNYFILENFSHLMILE